MKTISVEIPIQEAVECIRLLRGETQCLLDNSETYQDRDVLKRTQLVLSARERLVTALEEIADTEDEPDCRPAFVEVEIPEKRATGYQKAMDQAMAQTTGAVTPRNTPLEGELNTIAEKHG